LNGRKRLEEVYSLEAFERNILHVVENLN